MLYIIFFNEKKYRSRRCCAVNVCEKEKGTFGILPGKYTIVTVVAVEGRNRGLGGINLYHIPDGVCLHCPAICAAFCLYEKFAKKKSGDSFSYS